MVMPHSEDEYRKAFLKFVADAPELVDMKTRSGTTPLHHALQMNRWWNVKILLEAGANPLLPDDQGNTPLHYLAPFMCTSNGATEWLAWFKKFLALGVDINAKNKDGETALFRFFTAGAPQVDYTAKACDFAHRRLYQPFKDAGADILTKNNEGKTLLHVIPHLVAFPGPYRNSAESVDTFKFLMEMGVDPMTEDRCQRTALDVAAACGNKAILDLFKRENSSAAMPPVAVKPIAGDSDDDW
jgi:ankyrin repeat protein